MDVNIEAFRDDVQPFLRRLEERDVITRIWLNDHTVWKPSPKEIADRLGWLTIAHHMRNKIPELQEFAEGVRQDGFRHVVLLGMGGSSLASMVLRCTFGTVDGFPELIVLDSTLPESIQTIVNVIDPIHTLFIVSSKSGTTVEPLSLMDHFQSIVEGISGEKRAGKNFISITDPGTPLERLAERGKDKLTLVVSPAIASFGLWLEQLIAESIGKEEKGIIPIIGEPLVEPRLYGDDRLFVYLRLENDDNDAPDRAIDTLQSAGKPVVILRLRDKYDLGAEFFRWEFAAAVAGAVMGVHPFDQPDVREAKDATNRVLQECVATGWCLAQPETDEPLSECLARARKGMYLAIMAYLPETAEVDRALTDLRRRILERYGIATMLGYGPRYLHSTGQLHKGGPNIGLFLQFTLKHAEDFPVPGKSYTFGMLADAQASGDYRVLRELGRPVVGIRLPWSNSNTIARAIADWPI